MPMLDTTTISNLRRPALYRWLVLGLLCIAAPLWAAPDYRIDTLAEGLEYPWSIAFLPDGDMLVTERGGRLFQLAPDGSRREIAGVPDTYVHSQGGLFDVLPARDFATSRQIFLLGWAISVWRIWRSSSRSSPPRTPRCITAAAWPGWSTAPSS